MWNSFFPINREYQKYLWEEVNSIVQEGGGGYTFEAVWKMPIPMRKLIIKMINEKREAMHKSMNGDSNVLEVGKTTSKQLQTLRQQYSKNDAVNASKPDTIQRVTRKPL